MGWEPTEENLKTHAPEPSQVIKSPVHSRDDGDPVTRGERPGCSGSGRGEAGSNPARALKDEEMIYMKKKRKWCFPGFHDLTTLFYRRNKG